MIGRAFTYTSILVCNQGTPVNNVPELVAYAKRNPDKLTNETSVLFLGVNVSCAKFVSYIVEFAGNGSNTNTIDSTCAAGGDQGFMGRHVRLVA